MKKICSDRMYFEDQFNLLDHKLLKEMWYQS